jgi:hypothetical protein
MDRFLQVDGPNGKRGSRAQYEQIWPRLATLSAYRPQVEEALSGADLKKNEPSLGRLSSLWVEPEKRLV